jgi:formylglycine-generating enzyme required for sulfatase activity
MRRLPWIVMAAVLLVAACAPASTPIPTAIPATIAIEPSAAPAAPAATLPATLAPAALAGPQAATSMAWMDGAILVYVPAGEFTMGTGIGSTPEKTVYLDGYWIDSTEVTNKMYSQCVATGNCAAPAQEVGAPVYSNPQYGDYPVVGVTWDMAANYCKWTQGQLPTEAQWEKAARGESGSIFPWGISSPSCSLLNYKGCVGHTTAVTDFPDGRSPYGGFDMAGNVFQWVNDFYDEHAYDSMPTQNPAGPGSGDSHVLRGSSFETDAGLLSAAVRHFGGAKFHSGELGFRCVVSQPKTLAPYCQLSSYIPTGAGAPQGTCQPPQIGVERNYCSNRVGFSTVEIPSGATYRVSAKGYTCSEAVVDGQRILTCTGPDKTSAQATVCNPACSGAPSQTGATVVCDPGYGLDASTGACIYKPASSEPGVSGCPPGYNLIQRGDTKICAVGRNQNGECPAGTYFDGQYGACVSGSGSADAPYGIDNANLASQSYQGCAAGYTYDPNYQCCQSSAGGAYPGCPLGFAFDSSQRTCVPQQVSVSAPGCVNVTMNIARCAEVRDVCFSITYEGTCRRNPLCQWDDRLGQCSLKKALP